jgi:hypothetical protein
MTDEFDKFYQRIVTEYLTAKSKRNNSNQKSRYWNNNLYPTASNKRVRSSNKRISDSQKTKVYKQQQYTGNYWKEKGVRVRNKSEKSADEAGIAKGLGGRLRISGVNPRQPGAKVNSKQGDMIVKYTLPNGISKIGSRGKTQYDNIEKIFGDDS